MEFENDNLINFTSKSWSHHLDVNLKAPAYLTKEFAKNTRGKNNNIINIIDQRVFKLTPFFFSYTLSKTALYTLTKTSAMSLSPEIRVNGIAPGAIETPSTAFITQNKAMHEATVRWIPQGRLGKPDDIALAALYLASSAGGFVSGKIIEVDGGMAALPGMAIEARIARPDD